jgi:LPS O-antigen subunit length determinant protein (WzzB/FepE family)
LVVKLNTELRQRAVDEGEKSIAYLNQQIEQTSITDLRSVLFKLVEEHTKSITLAKVNEEYALKVIDPAAPPETKAKPKRGLMVVIGFILGGMLAVLFVFARRAVAGNQQNVA